MSAMRINHARTVPGWRASVDRLLSRGVFGLVCPVGAAWMLVACTGSRVLSEPAPPRTDAYATAECASSPCAERSTGTTAPPSDATGVSNPTADAHRCANSGSCKAAECAPWPGARSREQWIDKSYAVAAADIVAFEFLLNQYDRNFISDETYGSDLESIGRNLGRDWVYDKDPFSTNQFLHPYSGTIYHGFARSAGCNYWESLGFDFAGSALWEIAGETDPPSLNDQITTPFAGSFLGEALFRTANLMLENNDNRPCAVTAVGAALLCPSAAINRYAYGNRFNVIYPSHDPAVFWCWSVGARYNAKLTDVGVLSNVNRGNAVAGFCVDYGLPGKCGYTYDRPFDYFHLEATATSSENAIPENVAVRGLLIGRDYSYGPKYRGIWGLYGGYDYFSPEIFRVSSTAASVGTTGQYLISDKVALQGSLLAGLGFTASGNAADTSEERGYRYSTSPQAVVALRAIYGDVAMLDLTANDFFLADSLASSGASENENIMRVQLSLTVRVYDRHAIGLQFVASRRDPNFSDIIDSTQSVGAVSLVYTFLSDTHFGVVR